MKSEIAAARRGEAPQPGGASSAFSIAIAPDGVVIRNAVIEGTQLEPYTPEELQTALETRITAIQRATPV